ncbi:MAG: SEL1-like repeat protein [Magnetococcales bacterium]|nr:SEL1-like repeat protein [Magnetococcales bacterium]MBF0584427.1 SEL1-like repeat protein [Magnetococcales bacterium]
MSCLPCLLLLIFILFAPTSEATEKATSPAPDTPLNREIKAQRQAEQLRARQQEQSDRDHARRETMNLQIEEAQERAEEIRRDRAIRAEEERARLQYLEQAAQAREMDRRQKDDWKQGLRREAYLRKLASQKEQNAYLQWQAWMRNEDNRTKAQALSTAAGEKLADKQWLLEQQALTKRIEQERLAHDRMSEAAARREESLMRAEDRLVERELVAEEGMYDRQTEKTNNHLAVLTEAAEQGNVFAQYQLGMAYTEGSGVFQDYGKGFDWLHKAARQGNAQAQLQLGLAYRAGQGAAQDYVAAYLWSHRAALAGEARAVAVRDELALKMTPSQLATAQGLAQERTSP